MRRALSWLAALALVAWAAARPPNIVYIMADDLGYADIGPFGQKKIHTPSLDRMAAEGTCFTSFYAGAAVCAPTRCSLMTGLHTGHGRVRGNMGQAGLKRVPLRPEDFTVAELLHAAGYATVIVGKWGLGEPGTDGVPNRKGFDFWCGYLNQDLAEDYFPKKIWRNETEITLEGNRAGQHGTYSHDVFTAEALRFIEEKRARPFFLYAAYTVPHDNWDVPADSLAEYASAFPVDPEEQRKFGADRPNPRAVYAAMITRLDRDVGRIFEKLKALGLDRDTIVFFCSDNGASTRVDNGPGVVTFFNSHGPLRDWKTSLYEGGIRTPMIVRWPGRIPEGRRSEYAWAGWDFLPTAAAIAGVPPPVAVKLDGLSVLPALVGEVPPREGYLYWENPGKTALAQATRVGDLKAIRMSPSKPIAVYDLHADLGETRNVAAQHPDFVRRAEEIFRTARTPSDHWPTSQ